MQAIVLAGGSSKDLPSEYKADLLIGGRPMVEHVVSALEDTALFEKVEVSRGLGGMVENLLSAVRGLSLGEEEYVLISSCDIPFLTGEAVRGFLEGCSPGFDLYYPVVERHACEERFPGVRRTYVRLKDGTFTGGNLFLVKAGVLPRLGELLERLYAKRKSPVAIARELGFGTALAVVWSALFGTLSVEDLERKAEQLTGLRAKAVFTPFAEIGTDIDKVEDLALVKHFSALHHLS